MSPVWLIAAASRGPVRLITGEFDVPAPAAPEAAAWVWPAVLGGLAVVGIALLIWRLVSLRRGRSWSVEERAFRALTRRVGLGPARRERVRRVIEAGMPGVPPVALLVSPSALERACAAAELKPGMREPTRQVRLWLGVAASTGASPRPAPSPSKSGRPDKPARPAPARGA
jgi:hypothetical protein